MNIIDFSPYKSEDGKISLSDRIKNSLKFGFSWYAEMKAQQLVVKRLAKVLDNKFTLIQNAILPDLDIPIPIILVGPPGVTVIYTNTIKGIYQAKGEVWSVLNSRSHNFKPKKPNLLTRTKLMARAVSMYLTHLDFLKKQGQVDGVIIFSNPGADVDTLRPIIRIVLSDAIEYFASSLIQSPQKLSIEEIHKVVEYITAAQIDKERESVEDN
ncbi:MAG: hypothetical protein J7L73_02215, partial [Anaerolineales bacterium]|nr:hypothetical protein [Anaerolineales bacterium]